MDNKSPASRSHTIPFVATVDETFDVGVDTRMGVADNDYQPPFRFTGKLDKLTIKLLPLKAARKNTSSNKSSVPETVRSKA